AVIVEHVAPAQPAEPGRAEVITDVGETDASRGATRARDRGQYGGLPHAEAMTAGQHRARTKRVERPEIAVWRVDDPGADRVVETHGPGHGIGLGSHRLTGGRDDRLRKRVQDSRGAVY